MKFPSQTNLFTVDIKTEVNVIYSKSSKKAIQSRALLGGSHCMVEDLIQGSNYVLRGDLQNFSD